MESRMCNPPASWCWSWSISISSCCWSTFSLLCPSFWFFSLRVSKILLSCSRGPSLFPLAASNEQAHDVIALKRLRDSYENQSFSCYHLELNSRVHNGIEAPLLYPAVHGKHPRKSVVFLMNLQASPISYVYLGVHFVLPFHSFEIRQGIYALKHPGCACLQVCQNHWGVLIQALGFQVSPAMAFLPILGKDRYPSLEMVSPFPSLISLMASLVEFMQLLMYSEFIYTYIRYCSMCSFKALEKEIRVHNCTYW